MKKHSDIFTHTDCISEEMLIRHVSGKLSSAEKHQVEKHLLDCEMCSDAVEGLAMIGDKNRISKITAELNQKVQERAAKSGDRLGGGKVINVNFFRQYRSQLAIAASVVVLLGLVFVFRSNMKELDQESSDKIFAEKFEAPPADLATSETEEAETADNQTSGEYPVAVAAQEPVSNLMADERNEKEILKSGKDANAGDNLGWAGNAAVAQEDIAVQKAESESRAADDDRSKNAEVTVKANVKTTSTSSDGKFRDEDAALAGRKDLAENRNEQQLYKEKDKKAAAKPQAVPVTTSATGGAVSGSYQYSTPVTDKSVLSPKEPVTSKQQNTRPAEELAKAEEKKVADKEAVTNEVVALQSLESKKKSEGKERRKSKESSPKKSPAFYQTENTVASPQPDVQTKIAQTETGAALDSVSQVTLTVTDAFGATAEATGLEAGMIKYDKQDYAGAVGDFEATLKQNPGDEKALFYSAVSYLSLGQTEKAVINLNKVLENKSGPYYDSAQWYLSLAYIKNNDTRNARKNLVELQNNSKSRYQKQADETLKEMQK